MSVINNMLRDLDRRQGRLPGSAPVADAVRSVSPPSAFHLGTAARWMIGVILVVGAVCAWWIQRQADRVVATQNAAATRAAAVTPAAPAQAATTVAAPEMMPAAPSTENALVKPALVSSAQAAVNPSARAAAPDVAPAAPPNPATVAASPKAPMTQSLPIAVAAPAKTLPTQPAAPTAATQVARYDPSAAQPPRSVGPGLWREGKFYTPKQTAAKHVSDAGVLLRQGRSDEAATLLRRALELDPAEVQGRQMLAQMHLDAGQFEQAKPLLAEGVRLHPDQPYFAQTLARLQAEQGDVAGAIQLLETSRSSGRDDVQTRALLGALLLQSQRYEQSVQHYLVALRSDPGNSSWLVGVGVGLEAIGKTADAAEAYRRAAAAPGLAPGVAGFLNERLSRMGAARP